MFVRSWGLKERGWYRDLLEEPVGVIEVDGREIPVRAVFTRSERLKKLVDRAYAEKYNTPGSRDFVQGFRAQQEATRYDDGTGAGQVSSEQWAERGQQSAVSSQHEGGI